MEELFPSRVVKSFVARPKPMTHITMLLCSSMGSCNIFLVSFWAFLNGWDGGQDREGPLG